MNGFVPQREKLSEPISSGVGAWVDRELSHVNPTERRVLEDISRNVDHWLRFPQKALLLMGNSTRPGVKFHQTSSAVKSFVRSVNVAVDQRPNGPAIMAFLAAGGERPFKANGKGWSIHHLYQGRFPYTGRSTTLHAVTDPKHFSQSAGLVAIHPVLDGAAEEYAVISWLLRYRAFQLFGYDPDRVFADEHDQFGFAKGHTTQIIDGLLDTVL